MVSYDETYFLTRESWRDWRIEARELIRLVRIAGGARVLEIGCGGGGLLRMARARGASVVGVDTLSVALELARVSLQEQPSDPLHRNDPRSAAFRRVPDLTQISSDNRLPFAANSFDAILGQQVMEHLRDTDAILREWHRLLKPNGRLALATPNARYPDPAHFADPDHTHIFSPTELGAALERAGFVIGTCDTIFPFISRLPYLRAIGVFGYRIFRHVPYFATRGRTILVSAFKK